MGNEKFVSIGTSDEFQEGEMRAVQVGDRVVLVASVGGDVHAIGNSCTHARYPLHEGTLDGYVVTCPGHAGQFDLRTGEVKRPPPRAPEPVYEVKEDGDELFLKVGSEE